MKRIAEFLFRFALPAFVVVLWVGCVLVPLGAGGASVGPEVGDLFDRLGASASWSWGGVPEILFSTFLWAVCVSLTAVVLGIPAGVWIGQAGRRSVMAQLGLVLILTSLCIPPYLTYWVWGLLIREGSWLTDLIHRWPSGVRVFGALRLWWGLSFWSWPIVSLCLISAVRGISSDRMDLAKQDGCSAFRRLVMLLSDARSGLTLGFGLVFLTTLTSYVAFDLAGANTYGNSLRRLLAETGEYRLTVVAALPMFFVSVLACWWVVFRMRSKPELEPVRTPEPSGVIRLVSLFVLLVTLAGPVLLMVGQLDGVEVFRTLAATDREALVHGVILAVVVGLCCMVLTFTFAAVWSVGSTVVRGLFSVFAVGWVWIGLIPAAATGAILITAYNRDLFVVDVGSRAINWVYGTPMIVVIGHLARYGMIAILIGYRVAVNESVLVGDLRRMDAGCSRVGWVLASGPRLVVPVLASGIIGGLLSLSEVSVSVIVYPPGWQGPAERLLNQMHYAREDSVIAMSLLLIILIFTVGVVGAVGLRFLQAPPGGSVHRSMKSLFVLLVVVGFFLTGCKRDTGEVRGSSVLEVVNGFGSSGRSPGQFVYPRALAVDPERERLYIIDKTGRIQLFKLDGVIIDVWMLPEFDQGYPTGVSVQPGTGLLYVADTHESRVTVFDPDSGEVVQMFGEYGEGPGHFIFATDVAFGPNGTLYVSEYGGNDRVQVFDESGEFLFEFGSFGSGVDQFNRPQGLVFDAEHQELWIADACNHRLVVTNPDGTWVRTIGGPGTEAGMFSYPYNLLLLDDGTVLVSEYGNSRVQHLDRDGMSLGLYGSPGVESGYLKFPWAIAVSGGELFILDSGNNRVQVVELPG